MTKLSELFGRKAGEGGADKPPPAPAKNGEGSPITVADIADVGSRLGEENEALRNLLSDAGRKIGELDELKQAFNRLVAPFTSTLHELEQEKSQGLRLSKTLDELRAAYEALRTEFYQVEKSSTEFAAKAEKLGEELELARESNRALESASIQLYNNLLTGSTELTDLRHTLAEERTQREAVTEARELLQEQLDGAQARLGELEGEIAAAREKLALLDDEKRSLAAAGEQSLDEIARLTRRLTERENTLTTLRAQLGKAEASLSEATAERSRLGAELAETRERQRAESSSLNMRIEALQSRAGTADRLLADARHNLAARAEEVRAFDRKAVEAAIGRNNAEKRLSHIEAAHEARERHIKDIEQARADLSERHAAAVKTLKVRKSALARAEEKLAALTERNGRLEADIQVNRGNIEKRIDELSNTLQREQLERAVVEGSLEAVRKDNARLQSELTSLRSVLRRGLAPGEAPKTPADLANRENRPFITKKIAPEAARPEPRLKS